MELELPSLANLCIATYCRRRTEPGHLPHGLRVKVKTEISNKLYNKAQDIFVHKILDNEESLLRDELRNIREVYHIDYLRIHSTEIECLKRTPDTLYHTCYTNSIWITPNLTDYPNQNSHLLSKKQYGHPSTCYWRAVYYNYCVSALLHVINLNLPRSFGSSSSMSADELKKCRTTVFTPIEGQLSKRFPNIVKLLFKKVLPYVWWGRGHSILAEDAFLTLIKDGGLLKTDDERAIFMNELARMYLHFGEYGKASHLYVMAAETVPALMTSEIMNLQTKTLLANIHDIGIITTNKLGLAMSAWDDILKGPIDDPFRFHCCLTTSIASIMCHHSGTTSKFQSTTRWLERHAAHHPRIYLGLSIIYAMQGQDRESLHAFWMYSDRYCPSASGRFHSHFPGRGWVNPDDARVNPFATVISQAKTAPLPTIKTVWRKQLWHLSVDLKRKHYVGDEDHKDIQIWQTSDGFIVCDVHLLLPSIHQLTLHPLTGDIQYNRSDPVVCMCSSSSAYPSYGISWPHRIYEDDDVRADLIERVANDSMGSYFTEHLLKCHYTDGEILQLDLKRLLRDKSVEETKKKIFTEADNQPEHDRSLFIKKHLATLQKHISCGLQFAFSDIQETLKLEEEYAMMTKVEKKKHRQSQHNTKRTTNRFGPRLIHTATLPGSVLLLFTLQNDTLLTNLPPTVLVIVDVSDRDCVLKPKIITCDKNQFVKFGFGAINKSSEFFFMGCDDRHKENLRFDKTQTMFGTRIGDNIKHQCFRTELYNRKGEEVSVDHMYLLFNWLQGIVRDCLYKMDKEHESLRISSLQQNAGKPIVVNLNAKIHDVNVIMGNLFVLTEDSLVVVDTVLGKLPWVMYNPSTTLLLDETHLMMHHRLMLKLLKMDKFSKPLTALPGAVVRAALGYGNHVLVIELPANGDRLSEVHCWLDIEVPGTPTEACFIGEKGDFLVTATLHHECDEEYEEQLYQYSHKGTLVSILPSLGRRPHGFLPVFNPGLPDRARDVDSELEKLCEQYPDVPYKDQGWFIYYSDGHGAIACAKTQCVL